MNERYSIPRRFPCASRADLRAQQLRQRLLREGSSSAARRLWSQSQGEPEEARDAQAPKREASGGSTSER